MSGATPGGNNVFNQSAQGMTQAGNIAGAAGQYRPMMVGAGQVASTNLKPYMNPFTQNVINTTMGSMDRARQMTQNRNGAQATAAGAFGGSRLGLVEAQTNGEFGRAAGEMAAELNQANFGQGQQAAQFDIGARQAAGMANQQAGLAGANLRLGAAGTMGNLANLGFGMGQQINGQQMQQGAQQQGMMQALIDAAKGQWGGFTGAPAQSTATMLGPVSGVPYGQSQTTSQQPGLMNFASLLLGL